MTHRWKIYRSGGVDQVAIKTREDLENLETLDPKLWIALSMPTKGVYCDARTLELLDSDKDGHVRRPEVLAAVAWTRTAYKDPATLLAGGDIVALDKLAEGPVLTGARRLLANLGKSDDKQVTLADATNAAAMFIDTKFNGDGVVPADAAEGDVRAVIEDIMTTHGSTPDRSGKPGIDKVRADAYFAEAKAYVTWHDSAGAAVTKIAGAATAVAAVRAKVDDFFVRCRLAKFDARAAIALAPADAELAALSTKSLSLTSPEIAVLPLAKIAGDAKLPLDGTVNPAWQAMIAKLATDAVPLVGAVKSLTEADWDKLVALCAEHATWTAAKPAGSVESIGVDKLRAALAHEPAVAEALEKDLAVKPEVDSIADVEKLCRYQRDLATVLANYVNFSKFYSKQGAVFQAGTLYLDARGCTLVFEVVDAAKHATLAPMAGAYLAYCDCTRAGADKKTIAAAFTAGDVDNLFVGRNGVFIDRDGHDWQATIVKVVDNPISIRQAFWAPYKKLARSIEERIAKRAAAAEAESQSRLDASGAVVTEVGQVPPAKPEEKKGIDIGTVAALGVAVGGIAAVVVAIMGGIFGLGKWFPIGLLGIMLAVSSPSMLLAFMKLRRRNLGPLLDANGWAINALTRINVPFGTALTDRATLPPGSERSLKDPYAEKKRPWLAYFVILAILVLGAVWYFGKLDDYLPNALTSTAVLKSHAYNAK
ncbi:MAG: hypothetical protein ABI867_26700 [Kofleriaceae bacterium]